MKWDPYKKYGVLSDIPGEEPERTTTLADWIDYESLNDKSKELVESIMGTYPSQILRATAYAYADHVGTYWSGVRNLKWNGSWVDSETFLNQADIVGGYNNFNPNVAAEIVRFFGPDKEYRLAREYTVAVYVRPVTTAPPLGSFGAGEMYFPEGSTNEFYLWWD